MRKDIIKILCCPTCKGELKLKVYKEDENEIITGEFFCQKCKYKYPIKDGMPNFLPK